MVDKPVDGSGQEGDRGLNVHQQFSEFSSDLSSHFKYGEVRNKRHHKGEEKHNFWSKSLRTVALFTFKETQILTYISTKTNMSASN